MNVYYINLCFHRRSWWDLNIRQKFLLSPVIMTMKKVSLRYLIGVSADLSQCLHNSDATNVKYNMKWCKHCLHVFLSEIFYAK